MKPETQETPAKAPSKIVTKIARTKFVISARRIKKKDEIVSAAPKIRRRENCANTFGPNEIPSASPVKTAPKRIPYAASPAFRSPTKVLANPITAPAAKNAPSIPKINPRIIFEPLTYLYPSNSERPIFSLTADVFVEFFGISRS